MEQSNSSNTNQNNNQPSNKSNNQHTSQVTNTSMNAPKPTKPFKVKGKYKPKMPAPGSPAPDPSYQQPDYPGYAASNQQGQQGYYGQPPYGDQPPYYAAPPTEQQGKLKHSGLGITSFILSILSLLAVVIGFVVMFATIIDMDEADYLVLQDPAYIESLLLSGESIPSIIVSVLVGGVMMLGSSVLSFIGFVLGLIGLFMKQRRKVFSILGTVFNGLLCFGGFILLILSFLGAFVG